MMTLQTAAVYAAFDDYSKSYSATTKQHTFSDLLYVQWAVCHFLPRKGSLRVVSLCCVRGLDLNMWAVIHVLLFCQAIFFA